MFPFSNLCLPIITYRIHANKWPAAYKKLGFYGDCLLQFLPKIAQKASKRGLLAQKSGGLLEFQSSGGLIKSGLLFARIRYFI